MYIFAVDDMFSKKVYPTNCDIKIREKSNQQKHTVYVSIEVVSIEKFAIKNDDTPFDAI